MIPLDSRMQQPKCDIRTMEESMDFTLKYFILTARVHAKICSIGGFSVSFGGKAINATNRFRHWLWRMQFFIVTREELAAIKNSNQKVAEKLNVFQFHQFSTIYSATWHLQRNCDIRRLSLTFTHNKRRIRKTISVNIFSAFGFNHHLHHAEENWNKSEGGGGTWT